MEIWLKLRKFGQNYGNWTKIMEIRQLGKFEQNFRFSYEMLTDIVFVESF